MQPLLLRPGSVFAALLPFLFAPTLVPPASAQNQSVATVPVGFVTFDIIPGEPRVPKLTVLSLPLRDTLGEGFVGQPAGALSGLTSAGLQNSAAAWNPGQFTNAAAPHFIRIMTGAAQGRTFLISPSGTHSDTAVQVENQGTDLTTLGIVTGSSGDAYEIFPADTLRSMFSGIAMSGSTAQEADYIQMFNGVSWSTYFHNGANWRDTVVGINRDNVVIRPDSPILFYRRGTTEVAITLIGTVPSTPMQIVASNSGVTPSANPFPAPTTLLDLGLQNLPGWVSSPSAETADKVQIFNGESWSTYFYTGTNWQDTGSPGNQDTLTIPIGAALILNKTGSASGSAVVTLPLPYQL